MNSHSPTTQQGFTLIEVLVTLSIITALAVVAAVSFGKMRVASDKAAAAGILRQLQVANTFHATENAGFYVPISSWDENNNRINDWHENTTFLAYLTGIPPGPKPTGDAPGIPESVLDPVVVRAKGRLWDFLFASYGYNEVGMPGSGPGSSKGFRNTQITNPGQTAAFLTATDWIAKYSGRLLWENSPQEGKSKDGKVAYRHGGKAAVVYYDGSAGLVSPADMRGFDTVGGRSHPFWKANH